MANPQVGQGVSLVQKTALRTLVIGLITSAAVLAGAYAFAFVKTGKTSLSARTLLGGQKTAVVTTTGGYFVQLRTPQPDAVFGKNGSIYVNVELNEDRPIREVVLYSRNAANGAPDRRLLSIPTLTGGQPSQTGRFSGVIPTPPPVPLFPEGYFSLVAEAYDANGNSYHGDVLWIRGDFTAPTSVIRNPQPGETVPTTFAVTATVNDPWVGASGVALVQFLLDGQVAATQPGHAEDVYTASITATPGSHALSIRATDAVGNVQTNNEFSVTVADRDTSPPVVHLDSPMNGSHVNGTVPIYATVDDAGGVSRVEVWIDGANYGVALNISAGIGFYQTFWNTLALVPESTHRIKIVAKDAAGNSGVSEEHTVTVTAPAIATYIKPTPDTLAGKTSLVAKVQIDNPDQISGLDFEVRANATSDFQSIGAGKKIGCNLINWWTPIPPQPGPCYLITWDTTTTTRTSGSYQVRAKAFTAGTNSFASEESAVQIDQSVFHVTMVEPVEDATVSGGVYFTAETTGPVQPPANDVMFIVDGQNWLYGPNRYLFDSATLSDGVHTVQAYAAGGYYSQYQVFNVLNHPPAPGRPGQELE